MSTDQTATGTAAQPADGAAAAEAAEPPPPPPPPSVPWWRRLWGTLHSRFARQLAMVAVVAGGIAAVGHFVGGILGWWHAYEFAFGPKHSAQTAAKSVQGEAEALSFVVLPLTVEGDAADNEWFADALLGDVIAEVARLPGSFVIGRDTAQTYKGKAADPRDVARELRVRYVVRGSVRRDGAQIRLDMSLVDGATGRQRWAERYSVERAKLSQAVEEISLSLARNLSIEAFKSAADRTAAMSADAVSADDLAMRAFGLWFRGLNRENLLEATALLEQAVAKDPASTRGWGGLVIMNLNSMQNGWVPDRAAAVRRINEAATQLERLDAESHYAYQAKVIQSFLRRDWTTMLLHSEAWATNHRNPTAYGGHGAALLLNGRFEEAIPRLELALRLSPRDTFRAEWQYRLSFSHFVLGRYDRARDWGLAGQSSNPAWPHPPVHAAAMVRLGTKDEGQKVFDEFMKRNPKYSLTNLEQRLPGTHPIYVEGRDRLVASLRELGLK